MGVLKNNYFSDRIYTSPKYSSSPVLVTFAHLFIRMDINTYNVAMNQVIIVAKLSTWAEETLCGG